MEPGLDAVLPTGRDSLRRMSAAHTDPSLVTVVALCSRRQSCERERHLIVSGWMDTPSSRTQTTTCDARQVVTIFETLSLVRSRGEAHHHKRTSHHGSGAALEHCGINFRELQFESFIVFRQQPHAPSSRYQTTTDDFREVINIFEDVHHLSVSQWW